MTSYVVIKEGKMALRPPQTKVIDGVVHATIRGGKWAPIVNGYLLSRAGISKDTAARLITAGMTAEILPYGLKPGVNEGGYDVITLDEWQDREAKAIRAERQALETSIPGLAELQAARDEWATYHRDFKRMMEDGDNDGARPPRRPTIDADEVAAQYPLAAAYLLAQSYSHANHHAKATAGTKAMRRLVAGESHTIVVAEMEQEWSDYCREAATRD